MKFQGFIITNKFEEIFTSNQPQQSFYGKIRIRDRIPDSDY